MAYYITVIGKVKTFVKKMYSDAGAKFFFLKHSYFLPFKAASYTLVAIIVYPFQLSFCKFSLLDIDGICTQLSSDSLSICCFGNLHIFRGKS